MFQSRWALSFLRGPVDRDQIAKLMAEKKSKLPASSGPATAMLGPKAAGGTHPVLPPEITETFVVREESLLGDAKLLYRPGLLASVRVRFVQAAAGIDTQQDMTMFLPTVDKVTPTMFDEATIDTAEEPPQQEHPDSEGGFATLSTELSRVKTYTELQSALKDYIYKNQKLKVWKFPELKETSQPGESEGDFRARIAHRMKEERDLAVEKLRAKYGARLSMVQEQLRKAMQRVEKEKLQSKNQTMQATVTVATSVLGAIFGRKLSTGSIVSGTRAAGRLGAGKQDVAQAEESVEAVQAKYDKLNQQFEEEATALLEGAAAENLKLDESSIAPKKTDVTINKLALCWTPWIVNAKGDAQQGW